MKHSETNSFNTFRARCCVHTHSNFFLLHRLRARFGPANVWVRIAHVFIQTKPFYHPNTLKRYWTMCTKKEVCVWRASVIARIYWNRLSRPPIVLALNTFSKWIYVCMYHSFMLKRVKQYLARHSNGRYAIHQTSCSLSLVVTICMRFIHVGPLHFLVLFAAKMRW